MTLQEWLDGRGITQAQAARLLGAHRQAVSAWCQGWTRPTLYHAMAVERLTGGKIPLETWLTRQEQLALQALGDSDDVA